MDGMRDLYLGNDQRKNGRRKAVAILAKVAAHHRWNGWGQFRGGILLELLFQLPHSQLCLRTDRRTDRLADLGGLEAGPPQKRLDRSGQSLNLETEVGRARGAIGRGADSPVR